MLIVIPVMWGRQPLLGSFVAVCIFFARCIHFHLLDVFIKFIVISFSFCVFFVSSFALLNILFIALEAKTTNISSRWRALVVIVFYLPLCFIKLVSVFSRAERLQARHSPAGAFIPPSRPRAPVLDGIFCLLGETCPSVLPPMFFNFPSGI